MKLNVQDALAYGPRGFIGEDDLDLVHAPPLDEEVFRRLPRRLRAATTSLPGGARRGALLLSLMTAISSTLSKVGFRHNGREYAPALMAVVTGPPGSGKGVTELGRDVVAGVHSYLTGEAALFGAKLGPEELPRLLVLPANSSARSFFNLWRRSGGVGLVLESEIDALLATLKQDWAAHLSVWLRQAFQHEPATLSRVDEYAAIERPTLAVLLAGTTGQLFALFPSAGNGTYSRFTFYFLPLESPWQSGRPSNQTAKTVEEIRRLGIEVESLYRLLEGRTEPLEVTFSNEQWDLLDGVLASLQDSALHARGGTLIGFVPSIRRSALTLLRMASVLAVLRAVDDGVDLGAAPALPCGDEEFEAAVLITLRLLDHGLRLFNQLPKNEVLTSSEAIDHFILESLPSEFYRREAVEAVRNEFGVSERLVDHRLRSLVKRGKLLRLPGTNGRYARPTFDRYGDVRVRGEDLD